VRTDALLAASLLSMTAIVLAGCWVLMFVAIWKAVTE
jgi:hypothetical protein